MCSSTTRPSPAFYAARIPEGIHSLATFERWRVEAERADPRALHMSRDMLMRHAAAQVTEELFPERLAMAGTELPLKYRFAPGQPNDGLTLTVPLALLNQVDPARLSWLVPGLIRETAHRHAEGACRRRRAIG